MWPPEPGPSCEVSHVVTFHDEGEVALRTLTGIGRMLAAARGAGISLEFVAVLDMADARTRDVVAGSDLPDRIVSVDLGDAADARNAGVAGCRGRWVSVCDGDDHLSVNWLVAAVPAIRARPAAVLHTEYEVNFGHASSYRRIPCSDAEPLDDATMLGLNPWPGSAMAAREVFERHPYVATRTALTGFGYEDWHWNLETRAAGHAHVTAPGTCLYYRRKPLGRFAKETAASPLLRPTRLFAPDRLPADASAP